MLPCLHISFWAAFKRKHHKGTNQALVKRWWCTLLEISTNTLLLPKEFGLLQWSICQHMHSSGSRKLLPQGKQKGTCLSWKARFEGIYETSTHETNYSLSTGYWIQEVLVLRSPDTGYSSQCCRTPKLSTQNETEPALQLSPLRAGTTKFCLRALQTLRATLGASWHFIDTLRSPQIF